MNDAWKDRPWHGTWRLTNATFAAYHHWSEWYFRIAGWGLAMRDHRRIPPLFSERYSGQFGVRRRRYLHIGPFCIATFTRGDTR